MISDGMPSNSVYDIAQAKNRMMWFMTKAGPTYYDTREWYVFPDSLNLPTSTNSRIRAHGERIWVAGLNDTSVTVQYYQDGWNELKPPDLGEDVKGLLLFDVIESGDSFLLLLGNRSGIYTCSSNNPSWREVALPKGNTVNNIQVFNNRFYISTSIGLFAYEQNQLNKVPLSYSQLPSTYFLSVEFQEDVMYALGFNWFAEFKGDSLVYVIPDAELNTSAKGAKSSIVATDDLLLFGSNTPARLVNQEDRSFQNLLIDGKNVNIGSTRIFSDRESTIWVSDTRGLYKFNVLQFQNFNSNSGLAEDEVSVVTEMQNGEVILSNPNDLNFLRDGELFSYHVRDNQGQNFRILDIEEDPTYDQLLVATNDGGLFFYDQGSYETPAKVIPTARITSVETYQGNIYMAGNRGMFRVVDQQLEPVSDVESIRNLSVLDEHLGIYTSWKGCYLFDGRDFKHFTSRNFGLKSVFDGVMFEGQVLLATRDGLATISGENIVHWEGFQFNNPVYSLLVDRKGLLWIGSDHGLYQYDGQQLKLYDVNEGLLGNETNRNALYEDSQGRIWIGTEKGVSVLASDKETEKRINLAVEITEVFVNDSIPLTGPKNQLNFQENSLKISYRCLSYVDEKKINFRYRIKTTDRWTSLTHEVSTVTLNNLEFGTYQFEIQARFGEGNWGPLSTFNFVIAKPFYNRWWFYLLCVLFLVIVARTIFYFRYLILIKRQKALTVLIETRTKEIQELNDHLEEKVKERTQKLEDKNRQLEEYAFINAHLLRAPLAKIMSAVHVVEEDIEHHVDKDIIKILKASVDELDRVIYSINDILREE